MAPRGRCLGLSVPLPHRKVSKPRDDKGVGYYIVVNISDGVDVGVLRADKDSALVPLIDDLKAGIAIAQHNGVVIEAAVCVHVWFARIDAVDMFSEPFALVKEEETTIVERASDDIAVGRGLELDRPDRVTHRLFAELNALDQVIDTQLLVESTRCNLKRLDGAGCDLADQVVVEAARPTKLDLEIGLDLHDLYIVPSRADDDFLSHPVHVADVILDLQVTYNRFGILSIEFVRIQAKQIALFAVRAVGANDEMLLSGKNRGTPKREISSSLAPKNFGEDAFDVVTCVPVEPSQPLGVAVHSRDVGRILLTKGCDVP